MRPAFYLALSMSAAFLVGCSADHRLATAPASATVPTGAYTSIVLASSRDCAFASAINASGAAAGASCDEEAEAFAWSATAHAMTILPNTGPFPITITGMADNGTIVGYHSANLFELVEALKWKNDSVFVVDSESIDFPTGSELNTFANFICATDCTIVGSSRANPTFPFPPGSKGAIWTTGGFRVDVPAPAGSFGASFVAVGGGFIFGDISDENGATKPARYGAHGWELLPTLAGAASPDGYVTGANVSGDAIGVSAGSGLSAPAVLWPIGGAPIALAAPEGYTEFVALRINSSRLVVGYLVASAPTFATTAAYWTPDAGFRLLPNGAGGQAMAVNDRGQIVGFSAGDGFNSGTPMFWEPVPAS